MPVILQQLCDCGLTTVYFSVAVSQLVSLCLMALAKSAKYRQQGNSPRLCFHITSLSPLKIVAWWSVRITCRAEMTPTPQRLSCIYCMSTGSGSVHGEPRHAADTTSFREISRALNLLTLFNRSCNGCLFKINFSPVLFNQSRKVFELFFVCSLSFLFTLNVNSYEY